MKMLILFAAFVFASPAFAVGTLQFTGKVDSFTKEKVTLILSTEDRVSIPRSRVPSSVDLRPGKDLDVKIDQKEFDQGFQPRPKK